MFFLYNILKNLCGIVHFRVKIFIERGTNVLMLL